MKKIMSIFVIFIFLSAIVSAAELPNPASVKCEEDGYELDSRTTELGAYGVCVFEDSECGQWDYFRGDCKPKQCSKVEGYVSDGEFKLRCEPYEETGFRALFKKYFFLIFAWLWIEENDKSSFERTISEDDIELE